MKAWTSSKTSATIYQSTPRHNTRDLNLQPQFFSQQDSYTVQPVLTPFYATLSVTRNIKNLHFSYILHLCVQIIFRKKLCLFPCAVLIDWSLWRRRIALSARLKSKIIPYQTHTFYLWVVDIKTSHFVPKLKYTTYWIVSLHSILFAE